MYAQFDNPIVVQKYGGTSVGSVERIQGVAKRVVSHYHRGYRRMAIVVSAMAGETNRLVDLVKQIDSAADPKLSDIATSAGEQVSVALVSAAIEALGVKTAPLLGFQLGIITDNFHARARVQEIKTQKVLEAWEQGLIPVIAGFQGVTKSFDITTLGRGGSDTSAVAIAVALKADFCEINTDVDGFYSADPRVVPDAQLVEVMDYNVALEMAALGSKVLHSRCVELGAKYNIPIVVRNSFKDDESKRTLVMTFTSSQAIEAPVVSGVSVERNVARIAIDGVSKNAELITSIFSKVAKAGINVDIIVHNRLDEEHKMRLAFTISEGDLDKTLGVISGLKGETGFDQLKVESEADLAKVSIVGLGMQSHHGVASKAFGALTQNGIDIRMISTSEIKISCVVPKRDVDTAARFLHERFITA